MDALSPTIGGRDRGRSARAALSLGSGWLRTAVTTAAGLIATPLLVRYLGAERYGAFRMSEQWFAYLPFLLFGLNGALFVLQFQAVTRGGPSELLGATRTGFRLLLRQMRILVPAGLLMALLFPQIFGLGEELAWEYYWAVPAILLMILLAPMDVVRTMLEASQRLYLVNVGLVLQAVLLAVVGVGFAWAGFGLTGQLWTSLIALGACMLFLVACSGITRERLRNAPEVELPRQAVWRLRWPLFVAGLCNQFNQVSDALLAGALFGTVQVTMLVLTQRLFQLASTVGSAMGGGPIWVGIVDLREKEGPEAFSRRMVEVTKLNVGICLFVMGPVVALNERFVGMWVGPEQYGGWAVSVATLLQTVAFTFMLLYAAVLDVMGKTRERVGIAVACALVKVGLIFPFCHWFGLAGLPLASAVAYLSTEGWYSPRLLARRYGLSGWGTVRAAGKSLILGGLWVGLCFALSQRGWLVLDGWIALGVEAVVLEGVGILLCWWLVLSGPDRALWKVRVRRWVGR